MTADVFAVVLAAGRSTRYGGTKQLAEFGGQSLVARACQLARDACEDRSLLVVGHDRAAVIASAEHPFFIVNDDYADGIGTSIAAAARVLPDSADGLLLLLADQPGVTVDHLDRMRRRFADEPGAIVTSAYAGTTGPPVLFPRAAFAALARLDGDRGARAIVASGDYPVIELPCEAAAVDIDRPGDL